MKRILPIDRAAVTRHYEPMEKPRHIVITGASSGIGAALVEAYAAHGIRLSLLGRDEQRLNHIAEKAELLGATVTTKRLDVADTEAMAAWIASCEKLAPIDLVIANAGIGANDGAAPETFGPARQVFATNLNGVLNTLHPVIPFMTSRGAGQIAIMSSLASFRGSPMAAAYCASKAAVRIYGEALRPELAAHGIKLSVICPGFVKTPLTDRNNFKMPFLMTGEKAAKIIQNGLAHNKARISFPLGLRLLVSLYCALPFDLIERCMVKIPPKEPAPSQPPSATTNP